MTAVARTDVPMELPDSQVNSVFQQPWWLEAVAPGQWAAAEYRVAGELRGRHPYVLRRTRGLTVLTQPPFTQTLGPWLAPSQAKYAKSLGQQKDVMEALIAQLPVCDAAPPRTSTTPERTVCPLLAGVRADRALHVHTRSPGGSRGRLGRISGQHSGGYTQGGAQPRLAVDESNDLEELIRLVTLTFERQGVRHRLDVDALRRVDAACAQRAARSLLLAVRRERPGARGGIPGMGPKQRVLPARRSRSGSEE